MGRRAAKVTQDEIARALKARVEELRKALEPFAKEAQRYVSAAWDDDDSLTEHDGLTVAHFRAAFNVFERDSQK